MTLSIYAIPEDVKSRLSITTSIDDAMILFYLNVASRMIDKHCSRHFYVENGTYYFSPTNTEILFVPDLYSVNTLKNDLDGDGVYEDILSVNDYILTPLNRQTKSAINLKPDSGKYFNLTDLSSVEVDGLWGYVDTPLWFLSASSGLCTGSGETLTVDSLDTSLKVGMTIQVEEEQCLITAIDTLLLTITVSRGLNGSTQIAHGSLGEGEEPDTLVPIYYAKFPEIISLVSILIASRLLNSSGNEHIKSETLAGRSITYQDVNAGFMPYEELALTPYVRMVYV